MSYKEKILNEIKESLADHLKSALNDSMKDFMSILDHNLNPPVAKPNSPQPIISSSPDVYQVTDKHDKVYNYNYFFSIRVAYADKERFLAKCKEYNPGRQKDKWPIHFEFNYDTKCWDVYSDNNESLEDVANYSEENLQAEVVEKRF